MKQMAKTRWRQFARGWLDRLAAIGNHDFCPWANRYVYWLKQPIGWLVVAAIAAALVGAFVAPQGWYVAGLVLLVMGLGVAWPWLAMRGLTAEIAFDRRRCQEQQPVQVTLTVTSRWPWPVWGLLVEEGFLEPDKESMRPAAMALARVTGWSRSQFEFSFTPPARGIYPHDVPMLSTGFPFGIWMSRRPIPVLRELIVWPRCVDLKSLPLWAGTRLSAVGSFVDRAGHDGDILAARHYREGDSLRRIHWAHTARRDTLIVCERQAAARRRVLLVLDPDAFRGETAEQRDLLAWALRVIASLSRELHDHACELVCELNGEQVAVAPSVPALHGLFDRLARFEPAQISHPAIRGTRSDPPGRLAILITSSAVWEAAENAAHARWPGARAVVLHGTGDGVEPIRGGRNVEQRQWLGPAIRTSRGPVKGARNEAVTGTLGGEPWMRLDTQDDPAHQLQRQWERQCHDDWCLH